MSTRYRFWLQEIGPDADPDAQVLIRQGGSSMGRDRGGDIVFPPNERNIHRLHATIRPSGTGLTIRREGRNPVLVNGRPIDKQASVGKSDELGIGRFRFVVRTQAITKDAPSWLLSGLGTNAVGVAPMLSVGGGEADDVRLADWPKGALVFYEADGVVILESNVQAELNGSPLVPETLESLRSGDLVGYRGRTIELIASTGGTGLTTVVEGADAPPSALLLVWEADGALLTVQYPSACKTVWLSEKRASLFSTLMAPPKPYTCGETVPDDLMVKKIWPGVVGKGPVAINGMVLQARRAMLKKGINGYALMEKGKGGLRLTVQPGTTVTVR